MRRKSQKSRRGRIRIRGRRMRGRRRKGRRGKENEYDKHKQEKRTRYMNDKYPPMNPTVISVHLH